MRKGVEIGGAVVAIALIAAGVVAIALAVDTRQTAEDTIGRSELTGTAAMTQLEAEVRVLTAELSDRAGDLPQCDIAGEPVENGEEARCLAEHLRVQNLLATGGHTYTEIGRYVAAYDAPEDELAPGGGTHNPEYTSGDGVTGRPAINEDRQAWATTTALATALNASYLTERLSVLGIVLGAALLLTGIGFAVLLLATAVRDPGSALRLTRRAADSG